MRGSYRTPGAGNKEPGFFNSAVILGRGASSRPGASPGRRGQALNKQLVFLYKEQAIVAQGNRTPCNSRLALCVNKPSRALAQHFCVDFLLLEVL